MASPFPLRDHDFDFKLASETAAPPQGLVDSARCLADSNNKRLHEFVVRLEALADRMTGAVPVPGNVEGAVQSQIPDIDLLHSALHDIEPLLERLAAATDRLERL